MSALINELRLIAGFQKDPQDTHTVNEAADMLEFMFKSMRHYRDPRLFQTTVVKCGDSAEAIVRELMHKSRKQTKESNDQRRKHS